MEAGVGANRGESLSLSASPRLGELITGQACDVPGAGVCGSQSWELHILLSCLRKHNPRGHLR